MGIQLFVPFCLPSLLPPLLPLIAPVLVPVPVVLLALLAAVFGPHAVFAHEKILRGVAVPAEFSSVKSEKLGPSSLFLLKQLQKVLLYADYLLYFVLCIPAISFN